MRSLYSTSSGNPNLLSESGKLWELGASWTGGVSLSGAVFFNDFKDMIESLRLPDGTRKYYNINRAYINGAEIQVQKPSRQAAVTVNYTYLDHRNQTENRPLDALPRHTLNFEGLVRPLLNVRLSLFGLYASRSEWYDFSAGRRLPIPSYFDLDTVLSYSWARLELFLKLGNIFNEAYFTEPGFPCPGRTLEIGVRADVFGK
jgi:iron complex outermembrane receptor protein